MTAHIQDYVASGYFLSRHVGPHDCTGVELRRVTLANDHSPRKFFPDSWSLSWCGATREQRLEEAAVFGITERNLDDAIAWADRSFDTLFGAWSVFFELEQARAVARTLLRNAADLELWGVGLHRALVSAYCAASKPAPPRPGYAPTGASGTHVATCARAAPLAEGGVALGHEILVDETGSCFNSPESRHLDEQGLLQEAGIVRNRYGLIDSFEDALAGCRVLDGRGAEARHGIVGWLPRLIVRYSL